MSAAHFSFMGICRNTTFEVLYCNLFSGISRWYHYHKSEVNSMKAEKKEINIQIGKVIIARKMEDNNNKV